MGLKPEQDLGALLASSLGLTLGQDCVEGPVRPPDGLIKQKAVFVLPTGGPAPEPSRPTKAIRYASVQLRIRGDVDKYDAGLLFARAIRDVTHFAAIANYIDCEVLESEPNWLGYDNEHCPEWSHNVRMKFEE